MRAGRREPIPRRDRGFAMERLLVSGRVPACD